MLIPMNQPVTDLGTFLSDQVRGKRSPASSFSSASSRSSTPYRLAVVTELDEENSESTWPAPKQKLGVSICYL